MQSYGTERDRSYLLDIERRELNVNAVFLRATQLSQPIYVEPPVPSSMSMYLRQPWETPTDDTYTPLDSTDMKLLKSENKREQSGVSRSGDVQSRMETAHVLAAITEGIAAVEVEVEVEGDGGVDEKARSASRNIVKRDSSAHASSTASATHSTDNHREVSSSLKPDTAHILEVAAAAADAAMSDLNYLLRDTEEGGEDDEGDDDDQYLQQNTHFDNTGCASLTVIFDGPSRALCDFKVKVAARNGDSQQELKGLERSDEAIESNAVGGAVGSPRAAAPPVGAAAAQRGVHGEDLESWIDDYLISSVSDSDSGSFLTNGITFKSENGSDGDAASTADHCQPLPLPLPLVLDSVELASVTDMEEEYSAYLGKKIVCPKVEDDVISRMIYIDRLSYSGTVRHRNHAPNIIRPVASITSYEAMVPHRTTSRDTISHATLIVF